MFDDLARLGVFDVAVSGGEPLTRRDIFEVMEHAVSLGVRLGLGSNGSTVTPQIARRLNKLGLYEREGFGRNTGQVPFAAAVCG